MNSNSKPTKLYFRGLANDSSGKLKKIYIALSKGSKADLGFAFDLFSR